MIEFLYLVKHMAGKHSQTRHTPKRYSIGGAGSGNMPTEVEIDELKYKMRGMQGPADIIGNQVEYDPDVARITSEGQVWLGEGKFINMVDGECHWNASKLFDEGKIDSIAIGYVQRYGSLNTWYQHTWGIKGGGVVETTLSNISNRKYYGLKLSETEAKIFSDFTKVNPPGKGKVRRVTEKST